MAAASAAISSGLDGHQQLAKELDRRLDDRGGPDGGSYDLRPYASARERLAHLIHSYRYQVSVVEQY